MTGAAPLIGELEVSFVVVTYNSAEHLERCLSALRRATSRSFEIVVLDNASQDGTGALLRKEPDIRLVLSPVNTGFARGCNAAAALARAPFLVLVNPDAVVQPLAADELVDFLASHPQAGPVGGRTLRPDGTVDPWSCWGEQTLWSTFCFGSGLSTVLKGSARFDPESLGSWQRDSVREVGTVTGYFMALRRADWETLGGFDPVFFMYGDDVDLSARARRAGLRPTVVPTAGCTHVAGASSESTDRVCMVLRGRITYMSRHWSLFAQRLGVLLLLIGVALRAIVLPRSPWRQALRRWREWGTPYDRPGPGTLRAA